MNFRRQSGLCTVVAVWLFFALQTGCAAQAKPDAFVLKGVSFIDNTATLSTGADVALQKLLEELQADPSVSLEISCSVTASGNRHRDAKLGRDRAQTLRNWLINRGIAFYRLQVADPQTTAATAATAPRAGSRAPADDRIVIVRLQKPFPVAAVPVRAFRFEPVVDGQEVLHDFQLLNKGAAPLNISKVRTG